MSTILEEAKAVRLAEVEEKAIEIINKISDFIDTNKADLEYNERQLSSFLTLYEEDPIKAVKEHQHRKTY